MHPWQPIEFEEQLATITRKSFEKPQLIFKHSIRCGTSAAALYELTDVAEHLAKHMELHYLDLINHRPLSNRIANEYQVPHQSPQAIVLDKGKVVYAASHLAIDAEQILASAQS